MATINCGTAEQAEFLAGMGHGAEADGTVVTLSEDTLAVLADLPADGDGHYDGRHVWIGGSEYRVVRKTGRPPIGPEVKTRLPERELRELAHRAGLLEIDRSELIRGYVLDGLGRAVIVAVGPGDNIGGEVLTDLARLDHDARARILALPKVAGLDADEQDWYGIAFADLFDPPAGWPATTITLTPDEIADLRRAQRDEAEGRAAAERGY